MLSSGLAIGPQHLDEGRAIRWSRENQRGEQLLAARPVEGSFGERDQPIETIADGVAERQSYVALGATPEWRVGRDALPLLHDNDRRQGIEFSIIT
ncbi:MAG: hypothetical protein ACYCST_13715 [Acidimicrobiales bacterium]